MIGGGGSAPSGQARGEGLRTSATEGTWRGCLVDARGVLCPVPIIRLARATRELAVGARVTLLSDDPAAALDVPAWCRLRGHDLLATVELEAASPRLAAILAENPDPASASPPPSRASASRPELVAGIHSGDEPHSPNPWPGKVLVHLVRVADTTSAAVRLTVPASSDEPSHEGQEEAAGPVASA